MVTKTGEKKNIAATDLVFFNGPQTAPPVKVQSTQRGRQHTETHYGLKCQGSGEGGGAPWKEPQVRGWRSRSLLLFLCLTQEEGGGRREQLDVLWLLGREV